MRAPVFSTSVVAAMLTAAQALADPATPQGAQELGQTAAAYFGKAAVEHGVITITPRGESYLATIDLQHASDAFKLPADVRLTGRSSLVLTPMADGAWNVSADDFPTIVLARAGDANALSFSMSATGFHFNGVFDPRLAAFLSSKTKADSVDFKLRALDRATGQPKDFMFHYGAATVTTAGVAAGDGGVTIALQEQIDSARKSVSESAENGGPADAVAATYDIGPLVGEGSIEGLRAASLGDLWRFLVAHAEHRDPEPGAFQSALKTKIVAALPLWDKIATTVTIQDVAVQAIGAKAAMKNVTESVAMSGLGPQGSLGVGVKIGDIAIESPLVPAWTAPLTPTAVDLDVTLSAAGIDKIVRLAIDEFDGAATPPLSAEIGARMKAMLMSGDPKLTIAHAHLTSPNLDLAFHGALALTPPKPSGKLEVASDNLDKALAVIGKAAESDPALQKAMLGVTLLKGLAKAGPDGKLTWEIALDPVGAVTVNGMPLPQSK